MYYELEAQYQKFIELTKGKANNDHIDFHLWDNQRLPIAAAFGKFLRKHKIKRCRIWGAHQKTGRGRSLIRYLLMRSLSYSPYTTSHKSTRINYYINRKEDFKDNLIEFYVHPDIIDGAVIDNSVPIFGTIKYPLDKQIELAGISEYRISSWEEI